ncbi:calcineurin-binding protein [Niveomyces insectorum RCEF 264]|uniref:Calcineurin-binding protein n=1 Tax=Niveomyces insectorum RCEF 264 TaxID=1081102 RepID=A0A167Z6V5_9HYPO|nr:calcineurin-binding protein [Niveomyces insectorum RCEF 264]
MPLATQSPSSPSSSAGLPPSLVSRSSSTSSTSSTASSPSSRRRRPANLSLDLSSLPPPVAASDAAPAPIVPTNTLLLTNLVHPDVFRPDNLATLRDLVSQSSPIHSWAPLKSFRRIVVSFYSAEDAARVRAVWDGESILGATCRVYFGRATPLESHHGGGAGGGAGGGDETHDLQHLALPDPGKLFFISPPPSPPHGWEMRLEGAPNKQVHADDLAEALAKLRHQAANPDDPITTTAAASSMPSPVDDNNQSSPGSGGGGGNTKSNKPSRNRSRSATLVIYQPADHGSHSDLPAIAVEDMTVGADDDDNDDMEMDGANGVSEQQQQPSRPIKAHTARPPVELMHDA